MGRSDEKNARPPVSVPDGPLLITAKPRSERRTGAIAAWYRCGVRLLPRAVPVGTVLDVDTRLRVARRSHARRTATRRPARPRGRHSRRGWRPGVRAGVRSILYYDPLAGFEYQT